VGRIEVKPSTIETRQSESDIVIKENAMIVVVGLSNEAFIQQLEQQDLNQNH